MKQLKLLICIIAAICLGSAPASAQKGAQAIGGYVYGGLAKGQGPYVGSEIGFGIDLNYQYCFSNGYRIRPHISVGPFAEPSHQHISTSINYLIGIDNNIFFLKSNRFRPYINLGIGVGNYAFDYIGSGEYEAITTAVVSLGIGMDYWINSSLILQAEIGARHGFDSHNPYTQAPTVSVGIAYVLK